MLPMELERARLVTAIGWWDPGHLFWCGAQIYLRRFARNPSILTQFLDSKRSLSTLGQAMGGAASPRFLQN
jgi:hypothetical protein